ncbi:MAG: CARDB domain-containing protein [Haloferacaceae archaeon]
MRRMAATVVAGLVLLSTVAIPVAANTVVIGEPDLSVASPTGPVSASQQTSLTVVLSNAGEARKGSQNHPGYESTVTTARNVRVRIPESEIDAPIDVKTGTVSLGKLPSPASQSLTFDLEVGQVKPGTYRIPVVVEYQYVRTVAFDQFEQPEFVETSDTLRTHVTLRVEDRPQFAVVSEGANRLYAGDTGRLAFTIENTGTRTANRTAVQLTSGAPGVFFGSPSNPTRSTSIFVPSLAPGETRNLSAKVGATRDVTSGEYPVEAAITYRNRNDVPEQADPLRIGVTVGPERSFALRDVRTDSFRVDQPEAHVRARIVNTGAAPARDVVVRLHPDQGGPVTATNAETAVGDLAPGESKPVNFTVAIASDAEPGVNSFRFDVDYENAAGDLRTLAEPLRQSIRIREQRDPFRVVDVSTNVTPGGTATLDVRLRYVGDGPVSSTAAKLFTSDPLSAPDDGAYLGRMTPGETRTATFRVSASGSALVKAYESSVEVRYDEADGDTRVTDGLPIGVHVHEPSGGPPVVPIAVGVVAVLAAAGYLLYRRR